MMNKLNSAFDASVAELEDRIYHATVERRGKEELAKLQRIQTKAQHDHEQRVQAAREANDQLAQERAAQWKEQVKQRYLTSGLLTEAEFEKQWPTIKQREIEREIDARAIAQSALPEYANMI